MRGLPGAATRLDDPVVAQFTAHQHHHRPHAWRVGQIIRDLCRHLVEEAPESGDNLWVLRCHVALLGGIGLHIEQHHLLRRRTGGHSGTVVRTSLLELRDDRDAVLESPLRGAG